MCVCARSSIRASHCDAKERTSRAEGSQCSLAAAQMGSAAGEKDTECHDINGVLRSSYAADLILHSDMFAGVVL